ncbi:MAG TPA: DUF2723 domain-containing protein [Bacteroidetes bacterium]|nr:DUF2723 domain-containing protein [Bacteroidota bacterium]
MDSYKKFNNLIGWIMAAIASTVYILTAEPTTSFWDCGEYIATAYKLQVGHPPGAPLFQMVGRIFSLFAFGDVSKVAFTVNVMSAICSGLTIMFLFWAITHFAKKIVSKENKEITKAHFFSIFGAGIVGALAYTFTDSFWFSAVEGEVYAMSSLFTAITFWAILRWERAYYEPDSMRWLVLIAFLIGLSIGVHLLNLLCIPAIVFVFYFKKYKKISFKGFMIAGIISIVLLALIMNVIIPLIVALARDFELFFVNSVGMPFNTGTIIYFIVLIGSIAFGLLYSRRKGKVILNTVILAFTFILIGYSSFLLLVIRSNANTPIDENNPENAISLLSYLKREQYGDWPIYYGQYFNAPLDSKQPYKDQKPIYTRDDEAGKYVITDHRRQSKPNYDSRFETIFPRMWSSQSHHKKAYRNWSDMKGVPIQVTDHRGQTETIYKPTFSENLKFFFSYQIRHMYLRYFMWNFAGRQNDIQGHGGPLKGNWISGIPALDSRLGPQEGMPDWMANNKARNKFYLLPLLLGLFGLVFHAYSDYKNMIVVSLLFIMTGLAIIVYLNQYPYQPRERDYAYAASFYAFAMWIGLGVLGLINSLNKRMNKATIAVAVTIATLVLVPGIMAKEGWDDHDRSNRYTALEIAKNYLRTCAPNAILFTNGDNDTFPLWYVQEVEGFRTDVRVVNLSLLNTDWYIDQMKRQAYEGDPVPFSLEQNQYRQGTRDFVYFIEDPRFKDTHIDIKVLMDFVASDDPDTKFNPGNREPVDYFPTKRMKITVDSATVVDNGTVPLYLADKIEEVNWMIDAYGVQKNHLMVLDLLATNNWERPVYFAITTGGDAYLGLEEYFHLEGMAYRLLPVKAENTDGQIGSVNTEVMYDNMMNKFQWGNLELPDVYLDETNTRMTMNFRNNYGRLANALIDEGEKEKAIQVLDRCMQVMPEEKFPFNYFIMPIAEAYYKADEIEKANAITSSLLETYEVELAYFFSFSPKKRASIDDDIQQALAVVQRVQRVAEFYKQTELAKQANTVFMNYYQLYTGMQIPQQQMQQPELPVAVEDETIAITE